MDIFYNSIASLGLINGIWRFFYKARDEGREGPLITSNYLFILAVNFVFFLLLLLGAKFIATHFLSKPDYSHLVRWFSIALFFGVSRIYLYAIVRIYEKVLPYILIVFADFLLLISLTIWFVIYAESGITGVIYAKVISSGIIFLLTLVYGAMKYGVHYDFSAVRPSLIYGFPLVFHGIGLLVLMMSDRYFIKELISVELGGIYGIAYKFGMIMNMVLVTPFVNAWHPILFRLENDNNQKLIYQKIGLYYLQIATVVWLIISIGSKYGVQLVTTSEYYTGIVIIPWVAFSYLLYGLQNIFKAGILIKEKTIRMTRYTLYSALLNILLNILMIPRWGMMGAAVSTVISYATLMVFVLRLSQKYLYINWLWRKMMLILLLGIVFCLFSFVYKPAHIPEILKDIAILAVFPIVLFLTKLVSFNQFRQILKSWR